jgi:teichuronic acid biosynthesis glycosyltransferase TuaG
MRKLVSVITPAYNAESTIGKTIASVQEQTYADWELLIIDDVSSDCTDEIVRQAGVADPRIRYVRAEKNGGPAVARNIGISMASGFFIAFLDADDLWAKDKLQRQIELWEETGADLLYTGHSFIDSAGTVVGEPYIVPQHTDYRGMLRENVIHCSTALLRKEAVKYTRFDAQLKHEDYVFWLSLLRDGHIKAHGLPQIFAYVRLGGRNTNKFDSSKNRWFIYRRIESFSVAKSLWYFFWYMLTGLKKYRGINIFLNRK